MAPLPPLVIEYYEFTPLEEVTPTDIAAIWSAMRLTLHADAWARLPEEARRHFIVRNRNGSAHRYGKEPKQRKPLNQRTDAE